MLGSDLTYDDDGHEALCSTLDALLRIERSVEGPLPRIILAEEHGTPQPSGAPELFRDESFDAFQSCAAAFNLELAPIQPISECDRQFEWEMDVFARADIHIFEVLRRPQ